MADNQEAQNTKRGSIPTSAVLNFAALFILFTAILALQHYGRDLRPSAQKADEPPPAVAVEEAVQLITQPAVIEVPVPSAPYRGEAPTGLFAPEPEPVVTAAETAAPQTDISEVESPAQPKPKALPRRAQISEPGPQANRRPETEREISVEILDSEVARQTYIAANRGLPVPKENPLSVQNEREFIPFEKK